MTQPFISDDGLLSADFTAEGQIANSNAEQSAALSASDNSKKPAIVHPNFDPTQLVLDPARPMTDIPEPARRLNGQLRRLYGNAARFYQPDNSSLSKRDVIVSETLAEHLSLLSAAKLIALPDSFYHNHSEQPLLSSLNEMVLLDMSDIQQAIRAYPKLSRYGFLPADSTENLKDKKDNKDKVAAKTTAKNKISAELSLRTLSKRYNPDELLSSMYADDWHVILQPQQFDTGEGSLATDIMACSVAVYVLKQCSSSRKSINHSYSAAQICQYVRSYLLSQVIVNPTQRHSYRQIRIFAGHIIVAAHHLGFDVQVSTDGHCYFNLSSRCGLLTRYPNMQDYDINGWSS